MSEIQSIIFSQTELFGHEKFLLSLPFSLIARRKSLSHAFFGSSFDLNNIEENINALKLKKTEFVSFEYEKYCSSKTSSKKVHLYQNKQELTNKINIVPVGKKKASFGSGKNELGKNI